MKKKVALLVAFVLVLALLPASLVGRFMSRQDDLPQAFAAPAATSPASLSITNRTTANTAPGASVSVDFRFVCDYTSETANLAFYNQFGSPEFFIIMRGDYDFGMGSIDFGMTYATSSGALAVGTISFVVCEDFGTGSMDVYIFWGMDYVSASFTVGTVLLPPTPPGDGDDGGGTVTPAPVPTPAPEADDDPVPDEITIGDIEVSIEVEDGMATLDLCDETIAEIIDAAEETVVIDLSELEDVVSTVLPAEAWVSFGEAELGLEIIMYAGTLYFSADAVLSVGGQADGEDITSTLEHVAAASLTAAQQAVIQAGNVVVRITITVDGESISNLGGILAVTVPYEGLTPVAVHRVGANGSLELIESVYEDGYVTFFTSSLSVFAIGPVATALPVAAGLHTIRFVIGSSSYTLNGVSFVTDAIPFMDNANNRAMIPVRMLAEGLGATVSWDGNNHAVILNHSGNTFTIPADQPLPDNMGTAVNIDSRIFVPARFASYLLGAEVRWDGVALAVYIY